MQKYLDDCLVCQKIMKGEIDAEGTHCCVITIGSLRVAALKSHKDIAVPESFGEAYALLRDYSERGLIAEYPDAPGHWAVRVLPLSDELPVGKSEGRSE